VDVERRARDVVAGRIETVAELETELRNRATEREPVALMPGAAEGASQDITTSRAFACSPGDYWTITSTQAFYLETAASGAVATTAATPHAPGVYNYVVPTGVGSFAIISTISGAVGTAWKS
jgi:hypothetical protein